MIFQQTKKILLTGVAKPPLFMFRKVLFFVKKVEKVSDRLGKKNT
jgi:hypothetical protein